MVILEVKLNGKMLSRAGREDLCVLNTIVDAVGKLGGKSGGTKTEKEKFYLSVHVGGLASKNDDDPGTHLRWLGHKKLKFGDEISVRVLDEASADKPKAVKAASSKTKEDAERKIWEAARETYFKHKSKYEKGDS